MENLHSDNDNQTRSAPHLRNPMLGQLVLGAKHTQCRVSSTHPRNEEHSVCENQFG